MDQEDDHRCCHGDTEESPCLAYSKCLLAVQQDFTRHNDFFVQIINRSPQNGGSHWLVVSNYNCKNNEVKICDSAFEDLPII